MNTLTASAYLAGLIDGEGSVASTERPVVPLTIVVWIAWFVVTFPAALVACILGISGREEIAAWLWNHSALVVIDRA